MLTISIVTYKHSFDDLKSTLESVKMITNNYKLFIVDNSPTDELKSLADNQTVFYTFLNKNIGFGAAHNIAIKNAIELNSTYHLVLNPDIYFDKNVVEQIIDYMDKNSEVGLLMPEILYPNGDIQFLPKLLPSPWKMFKRKLPLPKPLKNRLLYNYEFRFLKPNSIVETPTISGCFSFFRTSVFNEIGFYDDLYFMYFEDNDLSRRVNKLYKTILFKKVHVYHCYGRGAQKSFVLFKMFLTSFVKYFNKWGWFFDSERTKTNKVILKKAQQSLI